MDRYEYKLKTEQIQKLIARKEYKAALQIVETLDWRKEKDVRILSAAAEVYVANKQYSDAIDLLVQAYELAPIGRRGIYRLTAVAILASSPGFSATSITARTPGKVAPNIEINALKRSVSVIIPERIPSFITGRHPIFSVAIVLAASSITSSKSTVLTFFTIIFSTFNFSIYSAFLIFSIYSAFNT